MGKTTRQRRRPISKVATTAIDCDATERPRWEEEGVTDGITGLTGSTGSWRWRRWLIGRDDSATMTIHGWHKASSRLAQSGGRLAQSSAAQVLGDAAGARGERDDADNGGLEGRRRRWSSGGRR
ncbi:hypothetical protein E2562_007634 [Oryza meyeriana var. granulata]|uniref:DUF834 domain-containing protein n=1 Tax=Oryza meyeriana var. granulata TaxID=110450 RepID=A0A6G1DVP7_9ORYZ|nr:hypothetical protein E2562_007634 [Oryza meyeriana var. granulata]